MLTCVYFPTDAPTPSITKRIDDEFEQQTKRAHAITDIFSFYVPDCGRIVAQYSIEEMLTSIL
jgi:hypothetical protein